MKVAFLLQKSDGHLDIEMVFLLDWADLVYVYLHRYYLTEREHILTWVTDCEPATFPFVVDVVVVYHFQ